MPQEAVDEHSFWHVLETKKSLMTPWPKDRANLESFYEGVSENKHNELHAHGGHFIDEDPGVFDASFFSISPREAATIDPQQRWALEAAYHAVENAGIRMEDLKGSLTAVYASSFTNDYLHMSTKDPDAAPPQTVMGTAPSILSNRISWFFDIHGPS
ncbi:hypothetical protein SLS63_014073 [Diaporthe eres]|uniref:Ketosynthase family 3 (KS3) domain-containing protein n=1 Tax=Diaporthe eres TaxID=83184 RepID=A0ABR1NLQ2_DIAER